MKLTKHALPYNAYETFKGAVLCYDISNDIRHGKLCSHVNAWKPKLLPVPRIMLRCRT